MGHALRNRITGSVRGRIAGGAAVVLAGGALAGAAPLSSALASDAFAPGPDLAAELAAAGVTSATRGSQSGRRMAASATVRAVSHVPERAYRELVATVGSSGGLEASLRRAGVPRGDAEAAAAAVRAAAGHPVPEGTKVAIRLGRPGEGGNGARPLDGLSLRARFDLDVSLARNGNGDFTVTATPIAVDARPLRVRGNVGDGLYWALRGAGVNPRAAQDYLKTLARSIDVGTVASGDTFDLVIEQRAAATGEQAVGPLLYAGLERRGRGDIALVRWTQGGEERWHDALDSGQGADGLIWPVAARISSNFGMRRHPILRYLRMHSGIDFAASRGTPIQAAADGVVVHSGRAGGYGNQVRIRHADGTVTSYSHMANIHVAAGTAVAQGQVIGTVGSTGLSTGPHLHYEVHQAGRKVDPRSVASVRRQVLSEAQMAALKARYEEYRSLPVG